MPKKYRILAVEDDPEVARKLRLELERFGHRCFAAGTIAGAAELFRLHDIDVVLLDMMLPDGSGTDFIRQVREESEVPIIVVSAADGPAEKVAALNLGADDYIAKPFWPDELIARIRAVLRRSVGARAGSSLCFEGLEIDKAARSVRRENTDVGLTPTEFELLAYLAEYAGEAISVERLVEVGLEGAASGPDALRVHVSRVRKKLGRHGPWVQTVWGIGYRFNPDAE